MDDYMAGSQIFENHGYGSGEPPLDFGPVLGGS